MTDQCLKLAEKAAAYKRGGNHVLKAISKLQELLIDLFDEYSQFRFIGDRVAYVNNLASSNVGIYGPALVYVEGRSGRENFKPLPPTWTDAGRGFYLHNDFHVWIDYATRSEIVQIATHLVDFLKSLAEFLEKKGDENEISVTTIEKIVSGIKSSIE